MSAVLDVIVVVLGLTVVITTALPLSNSQCWWVRMWDFPRMHIMVVAVVIGLAFLFLFNDPLRFAGIIMFACALYQGIRVFPYTRFARLEAAVTPASDQAQGNVISILSCNVLMENDRYADVAALIQAESPDIVLLMETDAAWVHALTPALQGYSTVLTQPQNNHYGMVFATRLQTLRTRFTDVADDDTPTLVASLFDRAGNRFHFIGLHPRPPVPGQDTEARDEKIRRVATLAGRVDDPVIAMGDFNDVAWSWTSERFKHHGGFLDPRIGRGMMASFDARYPLLRFPIDQLYFTPNVVLHAHERGPKVGSDHFPMIARLSVGEPEAIDAG